MSFQQEIPLAGQEFRPQERPPTPVEPPINEPPINIDTRAYQRDSNCGKTLITSTKGKLKRALKVKFHEIGTSFLTLRRPMCQIWHKRASRGQISSKFSRTFSQVLITDIKSRLYGA